MESFGNHSSEVPLTPGLPDRLLELEYHNKLKHFVLESVSATTFDSNSAYEYGMKILNDISAIIDADTSESKNIRELATAEKYKEATTKIIALLDLKKVEPPQA